MPNNCHIRLDAYLVPGWRHYCFFDGLSLHVMCSSYTKMPRSINIHEALSSIYIYIHFTWFFIWSIKYTCQKDMQTTCTLFGRPCNLYVLEKGWFSTDTYIKLRASRDATHICIATKILFKINFNTCYLRKVFERLSNIMFSMPTNIGTKIRNTLSVGFGRVS